MKTSLKKTIAGVGIAGAVIAGGSAPLFPTYNMNEFEKSQYIAMINADIAKNGNIIVQNANSEEDMIQAINTRLSQYVPDEETIALGTQTITRDEYLAKKTELIDKVENPAKESLLESIME